MAAHWAARGPGALAFYWRNARALGDGAPSEMAGLEVHRRCGSSPAHRSNCSYSDFRLVRMISQDFSRRSSRANPKGVYRTGISPSSYVPPLGYDQRGMKLQPPEPSFSRHGGALLSSIWRKDTAEKRPIRRILARNASIAQSDGSRVNTLYFTEATPEEEEWCRVHAPFRGLGQESLAVYQSYRRGPVARLLTSLLQWVRKF